MAYATTAADAIFWNANARRWAGSKGKRHPSSTSQGSAWPAAAAWGGRSRPTCWRYGSGTTSAWPWSNARPATEASVQVSAECPQPATDTSRSSVHAEPRTAYYHTGKNRKNVMQLSQNQLLWIVCLLLKEEKSNKKSNLKHGKEHVKYSNKTQFKMINCQVIKTTKVAGGWQKSPPTCTWCFWLASLLDCSSVSLVKGAKIHHVCILTNFLTTTCWQFTGLLILIRSDSSRSNYEANRAFWGPSFPCLLSWQKNWVIKSRWESVLRSFVFCFY